MNLVMWFKVAEKIAHLRSEQVEFSSNKYEKKIFYLLYKSNNFLQFVMNQKSD